jgi:sugar phosphate isomerase/epimerase
VRLAYSNLACPGWPFERCVDAVGEYGFDGLEIRLFDGDVVTPALPEAARKRATTSLRASRVAVAALDTSLTVTTDDHDGFLEDVEDLASLAEQWGAPVLRLFGGHLPAGPGARKEALEKAGALLVAAAPIAARHGVRLAVETHDDFSSSRTLAELLRCADMVAGAVYDSHHPHRMGESPAEVLAALGRSVWHVHLKDARRRSRDEDEWDLVALGEGEVPVRELVGLLPAAGYDGWVSLEFEKKWHPELAPPEQALPPQGALLREWARSAPLAQ